MTSLALLFTLSAVGISETSYLIKKRLAASKPVCPIGDDCLAVLESTYRNLFIIHNDLLGLLFYIVMSVITGFLVVGVGPMQTWIRLADFLVLFGSIVSAIFTYLQGKVIKAWCFWCLMSAFTIWFMGIIIVIRTF